MLKNFQMNHSILFYSKIIVNVSFLAHVTSNPNFVLYKVGKYPDMFDM